MWCNHCRSTIALFSLLTPPRTNDSFYWCYWHFNESWHRYIALLGCFTLHMSHVDNISMNHGTDTFIALLGCFTSHMSRASTYTPHPYTLHQYCAVSLPLTEDAHATPLCASRNQPQCIQINLASLSYWVATTSRLLEITGLFCKRALWKRRYSAKETYNFK